MLYELAPLHVPRSGWDTQLPLSGPPLLSVYVLEDCMPMFQTATDPAAPTKPPPMLIASVDTFFRERPATVTSAVALTLELAPRDALTLVLASPKSTPPATPTKPPAMPPAMVNDLKSSIATTVTDWVVLKVPSWLTWAPLPTVAEVVACSRVTPTPPAMPTNPPPALADRAKKFSLEKATTATPPKLAVSKSPPPVNLPSYRPPWAELLAIASTLLLAPMKASVSLVSVATPTATPTPT